MKRLNLYCTIILLLASACRLTAAEPPPLTETASPTAQSATATHPEPTPAPSRKLTVPPSATPTSTPTTKPAPTYTPTLTSTPTLPQTQGPFQPELYTGGVLPGTITGLYASNNGAVWMVSDQGFARLEGGDWDTHLQDLAGQLVWVDESGRVWAVNEDASEISRWEAGEWTQYGETEGWQPLMAWFAQVGKSETDSLGNLWVSTSQDIRVFDGDSWLIYNNEDMGLPPSEFEDLRQGLVLQVLENDEVWVGACYWGGPGPFGGNGVRWFDGQTWHGAESPVAEGCVTQIDEDGEGNVWVAVEDELWRYRPESENWSQFRSPEPEEVQRYGFATEMAVHPNGDVWIILAECGGASCFGATVPYRVHNGEWDQFAKRSEMGFQRLLLDGTGDLWAFWEPGISRIEAGELTLAADLYTTRYTIDSNGRIWIVTGMEAQQVLWAADEN